MGNSKTKIEWIYRGLPTNSITRVVVGTGLIKVIHCMLANALMIAENDLEISWQEVNLRLTCNKIRPLNKKENVIMDLSQIAYEERMIPDAPILATHAIEINASVERVWQVATDVKNWPQWHDHLKNAKIGGPFVQGAHFSFGGLFKHHLTLSKIKQFDLVMYFGTLLGYAGVTKWKFTPVTSEKTKVTFTESSKGFLLGVLYSNDALETHLKTWLEKLKQRAELN